MVFDPVGRLARDLLCIVPQAELYHVTPETYFVNRHQHPPGLTPQQWIWAQAYIDREVCAAGLRRSELCRLKVSDLDSQRMMLRVERGKGGVDREVPLSQKLLETLREYTAGCSQDVPVSWHRERLAGRQADHAEGGLALRPSSWPIVYGVCGNQWKTLPTRLAMKMWLLGVTWIQCPWLSMVLRGVPVRMSTFMVRPPNPS